MSHLFVLAEEQPDHPFMSEHLSRHLLTFLLPLLSEALSCEQEGDHIFELGLVQPL